MTEKPLKISDPLQLFSPEVRNFLRAVHDSGKPFRLTETDCDITIIKTPPEPDEEEDDDA